MSSPEQHWDILGSAAAIATAVAGGFMWLYKTLIDSRYVRKVEKDGTRNYVHPTEWAEMKGIMLDNLEESKKWRAMAKDWMEHP